MQLPTQTLENFKPRIKVQMIIRTINILLYANGKAFIINKHILNTVKKTKKKKTPKNINGRQQL